MPRAKQTARKSTGTPVQIPAGRSRSRSSNEEARSGRDFSPINSNNLDQHPLNNMSTSASQSQPEQQQAAQQQTQSAGSALLSQQVVQPDGTRTRSVQIARRTNPLAINNPPISQRTPSQERDPDFPAPNRARASYRRGAVVNRPASRASTSNQQQQASNNNDGDNSNGLRANLLTSPFEQTNETTVIEHMQLAFSSLDQELSLLRIERQRDRDQLIFMRSQVDSLSNQVQELRAEISSVELPVLRERVQQLEARSQSDSTGGGDNSSISTNGNAACLGEAVTRLVLSGLGNASSSRGSCSCSTPTTPKTIG